MPGDDDAGLEDTSSLTDADWVEIDKLSHAYKADGDEGLQKAFERLLLHDPARAARILGAFYPQGRGLADQLAEKGLTVEDFREMIQKLARSPTKH
jgi:SEC-C motif